MIREIDALKNDFELVVTGFTQPHDSKVGFVHSDSFLFSHFEYNLGKIYRVLSFNKTFLGRYPSTQKKINKLLEEIDPDIVIVHEPAYLPYFFHSPKKIKVVFNAHEYHPLEVEGDHHWTRTWGKIYTKIYQDYLPKLDLLINVNQEIADRCEKQFGVKSLVIPNASSYHLPQKEKWEFKLPLRFIHHGVPNPDRKLEVMVEAFKLLGDKYQLDLMLVQNGSEYLRFLEKKTESISNVRLIPSVSFKEIIPFISSYDLGVYSLAPISFNNQMALPNKFFEFVQARLPMVIGPSPVMQRYLEKYKIGKVAKDFSAVALADSIRSLNKEDLISYKSNLEAAAKELSIEYFESDLLEKIKELI
ncbi:glycosyltransferase family 4 protein [Algoriphagus aestuarii]|nr:glycosyltransferase family 4 protein [Algoriphagus aestuarii]